MEKNKNKLKLELGDWIQGCHKYQSGETRLSPPMYVVGIWDSAVYLEIDPEQGDPFEYDYEDLVPIELTDEILVKTGITDTHTDWQKVDMSGFHISVLKNTNGSYDISVVDVDGRDDSLTCRYVHELQHFLNLCEINKQIKLS